MAGALLEQRGGIAEKGGTAVIGTGTTVTRTAARTLRNPSGIARTRITCITPTTSRLAITLRAITPRPVMRATTSYAHRGTGHRGRRGADGRPSCGRPSRGRACAREDMPGGRGGRRRRGNSPGRTRRRTARPASRPLNATMKHALDGSSRPVCLRTRTRSNMRVSTWFRGSFSACSWPDWPVEPA